MIIVTGRPRSGTSMMMRCLEKAGIPMAFKPDEKKEEMRIEFDNPHGMYEGEWNKKDGATKELTPERFIEGKYIVMLRDEKEIVDSMTDVRKRMGSVMNMPKEQKIKINKARLEAIMKAVEKYDYITVNYDEFVNNPEQYRKDFESLDIDFDKLITGIDKKLFKNRGGKIWQKLN